MSLSLRVYSSGVWTASGHPVAPHSSVVHGNGNVSLGQQMRVLPSGCSSPRFQQTTQQTRSKVAVGSTPIKSRTSNDDLIRKRDVNSQGETVDFAPRRMSSQPIVHSSESFEALVQSKEGKAHRFCAGVRAQRDGMGHTVCASQFMAAVVKTLEHNSHSDHRKHLALPTNRLVESLGTSPGSTRSGTPRSGESGFAASPDDSSPENSRPTTPPHSNSVYSIVMPRMQKPPPLLSCPEKSLTQCEKGCSPSQKNTGLFSPLPIRSRLAWTVSSSELTPPPPRPEEEQLNFDEFIMMQDEELLKEVKNVAAIDSMLADHTECHRAEELKQEIESAANLDTSEDRMNVAFLDMSEDGMAGFKTPRQQVVDSLQKARRPSFGVSTPASTCSPQILTRNLRASPKTGQRSVPDLRKVGAKRPSRDSKPRAVRERSPMHLERSPQASLELIQTLLDTTADSAAAAMKAAEKLLLESLPKENVHDLRVSALHDEKSRQSFLQVLRADGNRMSRIRFTWHLAGSASAAQAIESNGIRCDEGHCHCGRYGRGGYVATSAAKANAYADSECAGGERCLFLVLAFPEKEIIRGEGGTRPAKTAADLPSHPTEYCFVDEARLHCVCRVDYSWAPTGRREKVVTAGGHCRAWRSGSGSPRDTRGKLTLTQPRAQNL